MAERIRASRGRDGHSEARRLYTDVVTTFPASPWAARALMARGELEQRDRIAEQDLLLGTSVPAALISYRELADRFRTSPEREHALWRLAELYGGMRRFDLAVDALGELGRSYPATRYEAWFTAAEIYEKRLRADDQARAAYAQVPPTSSKYDEAQKRLRRR
jgi:hypothetical protein